jgi:hypothetical protein
VIASLFFNGAGTKVVTVVVAVIESVSVTRDATVPVVVVDKVTVLVAVMVLSLYISRSLDGEG